MTLLQLPGSYTLVGCSRFVEILPNFKKSKLQIRFEYWEFALGNNTVPYRPRAVLAGWAQLTPGGPLGRHELSCGALHTLAAAAPARVTAATATAAAAAALPVPAAAGDAVAAQCLPDAALLLARGAALARGLPGEGLRRARRALHVVGATRSCG